MDRYIGTKIILAEPMDEGAAMFNGFVKQERALVVESDGSTRAGYKVVYEDGYTSWSPKETFERAYRKITDGELELLRANA